MTRYRKPGSGSRSGWGLAAALLIGLAGTVMLYRVTNAEEGDPAPEWLGVSLESVWPGSILLAAGIALAAWSMRALHLAGRRQPRTEVTSWIAQPPPGAKYFGEPPGLPSHKAELAAQGVEAHPLPNGQWAVRRIVR